MNSFTPRILRYESLPSTNNEVARLASQGAEEGVAVVAEEQTAGRGRLQRKWISPKGAGLYFSILLRPKIEHNRWPLLTLLAAVAVNDALAEASGLTTDIKWPNDLLASERKICGILAEVIDTSLGRAVVLGIGINLTREALPPQISDGAISVAEAINAAPDREVIMSSLLNALAHWYDLLHSPDGAERVREAWSLRSSFAQGRLVKVVNANETLVGVTRGIEPDGALRLESPSGALTIIRAGDVISVRTPSSNTRT